MCFCFTSVVEDCEETSVQDEKYFHLEFIHDQQSGLIDSMRLKEGHPFDINRLKLRINPIVCYAGNYISLSNHLRIAFLKDIQEIFKIYYLILGN